MFTPNPNSKHLGPCTGVAWEYVDRALESLRGNRAYHLANGLGAHASAVYWLTHALKKYVERVEWLEEQNRSYQKIIADLRSKDNEGQ